MISFLNVMMSDVVYNRHLTVFLPIEMEANRGRGNVINRIMGPAIRKVLMIVNRCPKEGDPL